MAGKGQRREKVVTARFYRSASGVEPVRDWLKSDRLSDVDRKVIGGDIQVVEYLWPVGRPSVGALKDGLWELRSTLSRHREVRIVFGIEHGLMVLVHAFIKKSQKIPDEELSTARKRWKDWKKANP